MPRRGRDRPRGVRGRSRPTDRSGFSSSARLSACSARAKSLGGLDADVLGDHPVHPADARPTRRVVRIFGDAALVELERGVPLRRNRGSARWRAGTARRRPPTDGTSCLSIFRSRAVSGSDSDSTIRPASSSCRLKRSPTGACAVCDHSTVAPDASTSCVVTRTCAAGAQQRAEQDDVHFGFPRDRPSGPARSSREPAGRSARADDQRLQTRQRAGDRVGEAEREEVGLRVLPQDPERQHDEARERVRRGARVPVSPRASAARRSWAIASAD